MTDNHDDGDGLVAVFLLVVLLGIGAGAAYKKMFTRRWHRGRTMVGPAVWLAVLLAGGWGIGTPIYQAANATPGSGGLGFSGWIWGGFVVFPLAWIVWALGGNIWEALVHLNSSPRKRNSHRHRRQILYPEAAFMKDQAAAAAHQAMPFMAMGAVWALIDGDTSILAADALISYESVIAPLRYWSNVEATIRSGRECWVDVPPPDTGGVLIWKVVGAYIVALVSLITIAALENPGFSSGDQKVMFAFYGLVLLVAFRHRIANSLEQAAVRRESRH